MERKPLKIAIFQGSKPKFSGTYMNIREKNFGAARGPQIGLVSEANEQFGVVYDAEKCNFQRFPKPVIGIIGGKGKMGNYFAKVFAEAGHKVLISDLDTELSNVDLAKNADIVIVSVPIPAVTGVIKKIVQHVKPGAALVDLTSLKVFPLKEMLKAKSEVIGLHPMFADSNPLAGQTIIACPVRSRKWFPWLKNFFENRGATVSVLTARQHDEIMGIVQALVHFADIAFGHALKQIKIPVHKFLKFAGPASELKIAFVGRLLAQDPTLYGSIQIYNPFALKIIEQYSQSVNELLAITRKKDLQKFMKYFKSTADYLGSYKDESFEDTNYLIHTILTHRKRKTRQIINKTVDPQNGLAVLGPPYTHTDLAADQYLESKIVQITNRNKVYFNSIAEVFTAVESGKVKEGIVPLENLLNGSVRETFDELFIRNVHFDQILKFKISHSLVALPGVEKKDIDNIASHAQALQQCKKYLQQNFSQVISRSFLSTEQHASTISALEKVQGANDRHTAVIIPAQSAQYFNLKVLAKNIEDQKENATTFVVIKKGPTRAAIDQTKKIIHQPKNTLPKNIITSIAFYFPKDQAGSLFNIFKDFADAKINLTRIESRPSRKDLGNHIFYLDFEGAHTDTKAKQTLQKVRNKVAMLKILGFYSTLKY